MADWSEYAKLLAGLISVVDPLGAVPIFLGLTESHPLAERRRTARVCALAVAAVLLVSLLGGELIPSLFGIGIPAFRVAGGILILLIIFAIAVEFIAKGLAELFPILRHPL